MSHCILYVARMGPVRVTGACGAVTTVAELVTVMLYLPGVSRNRTFLVIFPWGEFGTDSCELLAI